MVWMLGSPKSTSPLGDTDGLLTTWDGRMWSDPALTQFSYFDAATQRTRTLGCLESALAGANVVLIGCDARGDAWSAQNLIALRDLVPALRSPWSPTVDLSRNAQIRLGAVGTRDVALASNREGRVYAVWSQTQAPDGPADSLYASSLSNDQWTEAVLVLRSEGSAGTPGQVGSMRFDHPALAVDNEDRLHLVWSGGPSGAVFYSSAFGGDASSSQGWTRPAPLPAVGTVGAKPDIVADPRGNVLYVAYAVPYNENRGAYLTRSDDGGTTWTQPAVVFDAVGAGWNGIGDTRLALDAAADSLHMVWMKTGVPGSNEAREVYYAQSMDGGQNWSTPLKVTDGAVDAPRVVAADGRVAITWNMARTAAADLASGWEAWSQFSPDGGASWTEPARVAGFEQISGPTSLAANAADRMYLVGLGRGPNGTTALLFTQWEGADWSATQSVGLAQVAERDDYPVTAVTSQGQLAAVLRMDRLRADGSSLKAPLGTFRPIEAAELMPLPTFTPAATVMPESTATPEPTATPEQLVGTAVPAATTGSALAPNSLLLAGALALVVIVLGAVIALVVFRRR
jgi:hypothetical protein